MQVDLVMSSVEGPLHELVPAGATLVDLKSPRVLKAIPGLRRYLRTERPQVRTTAMCQAEFRVNDLPRCHHIGVYTNGIEYVGVSEEFIRTDA